MDNWQTQEKKKRDLGINFCLFIRFIDKEQQNNG